MDGSAAARVENLQSRAARWRSALSNADTGPLVIAAEIVALAENWKAFKEEAGGLSCSGWLKAVFRNGRGLDWFARRHAAVLMLGEAVRRTLHHDVAVYVMQNVTPEHRDAVKLMLIRECRSQNGQPLSPAQAKARIAKIQGAVTNVRRHGCARCAQLEEALSAAGLRIPQ